MVENIRKRAPANWAVESIEVAPHLPPSSMIPLSSADEIPQADLVLGLGESVGAAQLIPDVVKRSGVRAAIAPRITASGCHRPQESTEEGACRHGRASAFPKTFCTLTETSYGFRHFAEPCSNATIAAFARLFGRPRMKITVDPASKTVTAVVVERGAPAAPPTTPPTGSWASPPTKPR